MSAAAAGALERLAAESGVAFQNLMEARDRTARELDERRSALATVPAEDDVSVVLMGSWGRRELTPASDDDFMVLCNGEQRDQVAPTLEALEPVLGGGGRGPGKERVFGTYVFTPHLVSRIGLHEDDNRNLTRRLLLMLESLAATGEEAYRAGRDEVLAGYLDASVKDFRPPRFFLNDVVRYWRTICVDFVGKEREREGRGWALRNAKLRNSRKLLFAAGLIPILGCHRHRAAQMHAYLIEQFAAAPTDRLAAAFLEHGARDEGARALLAYDRWLGLLGDDEARRSLSEMSRTEAEGSELFAEVRRLGRELADGLLALLFETDELRPLIREYGVF